MNEVERQRKARDEILFICERLDVVFSNVTSNAEELGLQPAGQARNIRASTRRLKVLVDNLSMTEAACRRRAQKSGRPVDGIGGQNAAV